MLGAESGTEQSFDESADADGTAWDLWPVTGSKSELFGYRAIIATYERAEPDAAAATASAGAAD